MRGRRFLVSAVLLAILVIGGIYQYRKYRVPPAFDLSAIQAIDLKGKPLRAEDFSNKPLIVLYFATWCIDCRRELPQLQKLSSELLSNEIQVLLLSDEEAATLLPFEEQLKAPFSLYKLTASFRESNVYTLPTAYLIKANGVIFLQKTGAIDWTPDLIKAFSAS
jgi:thiol-disulfide isomerase/thioredoxin